MIWRFFFNPSAFERDPRGFALNAAGHALIGAAGSWFFPLWLVLAAYAAWEAAQWFWRGAETWDCLEDWSFVCGGAAAVLAPLAVLPLLGFFLAGVLRRAAAR